MSKVSATLFLEIIVRHLQSKTNKTLALKTALKDYLW